MNVITAIEPQKRRENRRSIFVDGEFAAGAHEDVILALGLSIGQIFDRERLVELVKAETARKALESALRLIGYRNRTVSELRKRLLGNDFPEEIVDGVIQQLSEMELLDDRKFSHDWVKSRTAAKPMGKTRLAWELRSKGVDAPVVEESLADIDENSELKLALSLVQKKLDKADRDDPSLKNRLSSFLRRRGFSWDVIGRVFEELGSGDPD